MMNLPEPRTREAHHLWQINIHSGFEALVHAARQAVDNRVIHDLRVPMLNSSFVHSLLIRDNVRCQLEDDE